MDVVDFLQGIFRWIHVVAGILWIGLLYFFNWVNSAFAATMDAETKKKVVPELMPRALYWFRWGAAFTWVTGVLLLFALYYQGPYLWPGPSHWGVGSAVMIAVVFLGVFVYDALFRTVIKEPQMQFWVGWVASTIVVMLLDYWAGFSFRGYAIHLGAMFGTIMAFNVWFRIWPAQQKIIRATKEGQAPDPALVAIAGLRSRHNTYMSVPLVFLMVSQHETWIASGLPWLWLSLIVLIGWAIAYHIYGRVPKVKGF